MVNEEANAIVLELSNGMEVELREVFNIGKVNSISKIEVYDCENNCFICSFNGSLPDFDDEDFDIDGYIKKIEEEIDWSENF